MGKKVDHRPYSVYRCSSIRHQGHYQTREIWNRTSGLFILAFALTFNHFTIELTIKYWLISANSQFNSNEYKTIAQLHLPMYATRKRIVCDENEHEDEAENSYWVYMYYAFFTFFPLALFACHLSVLLPLEKKRLYKSFSRSDGMHWEWMDGANLLYEIDFSLSLSLVCFAPFCSRS